LLRRSIRERVGYGAAGPALTRAGGSEICRRRAAILTNDGDGPAAREGHVKARGAWPLRRLGRLAVKEGAKCSQSLPQILLTVHGYGHLRAPTTVLLTDSVPGL
jgi:hypothetical protein